MNEDVTWRYRQDSSEKGVVMGNVSMSPQRSPEWYELRKGIPTCSRFDKILTAVTAVRSKAQETLICELIVESVCPPEEGVIRVMTADMEYGVRLEAEARCFYDLNFADGPVKETGFIIADSGLYGGSPDALVGEDGGVEIKCPSPVVHVGYIRDGVLPDGYKQQLHGYMICSGRKHWDFLSYSRYFPPFRLRVQRDDYTGKLELELFNFCLRYNEARIQFGLPAIGQAARKSAEDAALAQAGAQKET